jgi:flavin reductase (DIM6/NTAB) family NADH-FMN oxidoreductase RutF
VTSAIELRDLDGRHVDQYLVVGQVVGIHLDETYLVDGQVDTAALRPIARCGYLDEYAVVDDLFRMGRPRGAEPPGF